MKISIVYFSGTGNTEFIAKAYNVALKELGHQVQLLAIDKIGHLEAHDLLIVGGPIYAGNMPDALINWVRKMVPTSACSKAMVYSTSAGLQNANGVKSIGTKLIKKGYTLIDMSTYEMPRNFYVDKYQPTPIDTQLIQLKVAAAQVLDSVEKLHVSPSLSVKESVVSIDLFADLFRIMAKSMGKNFSMDESCIGCGKCERECPKQNIHYKDKKYLRQCMMCTRCIHGCPVNAISYKGKKIEQYKVLNV